jgi:Uma2 family endonuclease
MAITRYSVDDYEEMIRLGVLSENDRVELIRGEILTKMPIGPRHAASVTGLNEALGVQLTGRASLRIQDPIRLSDSELEPDLSVVRRRADRYAAGHPRPADILLIAEVSDSSLDEDRTVKKALYAEAGIVEYWIINLVDDCLEVYRDPHPDGTYGDERVFQRGDIAEIAALPGVAVAVAEIL